MSKNLTPTELYIEQIKWSDAIRIVDVLDYCDHIRSYCYRNYFYYDNRRLHLHNLMKKF